MILVTAISRNKVVTLVTTKQDIMSSIDVSVFLLPKVSVQDVPDIQNFITKYYRFLEKKQEKVFGRIKF
ncbi:hypothetical protein [Chryseobacterium sp. GP-SGM7]|uniref:hypothetical protein n=1 Tax=Chryseobacterium sp. GP-SGM7 TaxID=3411323 RepID=UPI003B94F315